MYNCGWELMKGARRGVRVDVNYGGINMGVG
jgi:hypothetical protein